MMYFKQLDSLRLIAVMIVIFHHLPIMPSGTVISQIFDGLTGVDLFFVLSGFLISLILLKSTETNSPIKTKLKIFYIRRFFRIFPIYYLSIFALLLINPMNYREYSIYDLLYISNFKMGTDGDFSSVTPHFWSLAVEEQFYLIWPFIIFFTSKKFILQVMSLVLAIGLTLKIYFLGTPTDFLISRTGGNLIYLASGGILAFLWINKKNIFDKLIPFTPIMIFIYLTVQFISFYTTIHLHPIINMLVNYLLCIAVVASFSNGIKGFGRIIFENRFCLYLGKISYGIYVYHMLMIIPLVALSNLLFKFTGISIKENLYLANFIKIILTLVISHFSWILIEKPINRIKERFKYSDQ